MSNYFTKYLPVKEEIKTGDMWIYKGYSMSPVNYDYDPYPQDDEEKIKQKVKLFLCSNDIIKYNRDNIINKIFNKEFYLKAFGTREGGYDTLHCGQIVRQYEKPQYFFIKDENDENEYMCFDCGLIMGEIRSEALGYVKENMEFNDDEVKYNPLKGGTVPAYSIKGPCGHFH